MSYNELPKKTAVSNHHILMRKVLEPQLAEGNANTKGRTRRSHISISTAQFKKLSIKLKWDRSYHDNSKSPFGVLHIP